MTTPPIATGLMTSAPFGGQQAQAARDVNTASLCRIGQETVQDIVLRTMEIFQLLRNMQLPNGVTYHPNTHQDRLGKLQEHLRMLSVLFRKLRLVYDKCNENCAGLETIPPEKLKQKNQQLKQIMDQLRNLIWEVNSMLAVRS
ncbi:mediator of RNA polymerase II transcription subunit 30 isoform X3 [Osmerus eperlanus]|uniref:mediator of RNA polymerase II transcription subunit 30 isoform X3 n=1 Tax=Osmerus eperlanus TaxID=29151 RepID=UPI002E0FE502